jgi:PadR family transcriptional regulator, regulatory protein PadR
VGSNLDNRDVQLTPATLSLVSVMLSDPGAEWHGFELSRAAGLKSGTTYPILARLEGARWLRSRWEKGEPSTLGRPRRRLYRLTGEGEVALRRRLDEMETKLRRARRGELAWRPQGVGARV